jgi:hypothetical protein
MPQFGNFVTADSSDVEMQAAVMRRHMDAGFSGDDFYRPCLSFCG